MFNNITTDYSGADASIEILIMLGVAFLLGYLFRWLFWDKVSSSPKSEITIFDDLKVVEGIGPKIENLLNEAGITSYNDLAHSKAKDLKTLLLNGGSKYKMHDPSTWPKQAKLASQGKWDELETYQDFLIGGKDHI